MTLVTPIRLLATVLAAVLTLSSCGIDGSPDSTSGQDIDKAIATAVTAAVRDETLSALRLPDGTIPGNLAELEKSALPAVNGGLPVDFDDALRKDASAAGEAFEHPVDEKTKNALTVGLFNALLRHGILDPEDPAGLPAECVEEDPDTGEKRIIPALHDGNTDNDDQSVQSAYNSWRASAAPSGIATDVVGAFEAGASSE